MSHMIRRDLVHIHLFSTMGERDAYIASLDRDIYYGQLYAITYPTGSMNIMCPLSCSECPLSEPNFTTRFSGHFARDCSTNLRFLLKATTTLYRRP